MARDSKGRYSKEDEDDGRVARVGVFREINKPLTLKSIFIAFVLGWFFVMYSPRLIEKAESLIVKHYCQNHESIVIQVDEDINKDKNGNQSKARGF